MPRENVPGVDWLVLQANAGDIADPTFHPVLHAYGDLPGRRRRAGVLPGTPILVSPGFDWDRGLARYFNTATSFVGKAATAKMADARAIKGWLTYLDTQGVHWLTAQDAHYQEYRQLRTDPDLLYELIEQGVIGVDVGKSSLLEGDSWLVTHDALKRLYAWAIGKDLRRDYSPIPDKERSQGASARAKDPKDKWLLPDTYRIWREVGLGGCSLVRTGTGKVAAGPHDPRWKGGSVASRNIAFADLMISTGLRLGAQASILTVELPEVGAVDRSTRTANAVNKFQRGYTYYPSPENLAQIAAYRRFGRKAAVLRARAEGRYDEAAAVVIDRVERTRRGLVLQREDGGPQIEVERANFERRKRLYARDEDGQLEPMLLWLSEKGLPLEPNEWKGVFSEASRRVRKAHERLGVGDDAPWVNPHKLRFSFALWLLIAGHKRIDEEQGYAPYGDYNPALYGAAYREVQVLLNHQSEDTTRNDYLQPMKGLRRLPGKGMFDPGIERDLEALIGHYTTDMARIMRLNQGGF